MRTFVLDKGEWLIIGPQVRLGIVDIKGRRRVRLGVIAPESVTIRRSKASDKSAPPTASEPGRS